MTKHLVAVALLAIAGCATTSSNAAAPRTDLPDFTLNSVDGESVHLSDYLGKGVVVLSFWATWCEPCKSELPHVDEIFKRHKDQGLTVLAVSMDDPSTVSQVAPYVKRAGYGFPVLLDVETKAANLYNPHKNAPYTVVIDRTGHVHSEKAGYEPGAEKALEDEIVALLANETAPTSGNRAASPGSAGQPEPTRPQATP